MLRVSWVISLILIAANPGVGDAGTAASAPTMLHVLWRLPTHWLWLRTPEVRGTSIYTMTKFGSLSELSLIDGRVLREVVPPQEGSYERPLVDGNALFLSCGNSNLSCFERQTLSLSWSRYMRPPDAVTGWVHVHHSLSRPVVDATGVYFASSDGELYSLERGSGVLRWRYSLGAMSGDASPLLLSGVLYAAGRDSSVTAIDPASGRRLWRVELGVSVNGMRAVGPLLYCSGLYGSVACVDTGSRSVRWTKRVGEVFRGQISASRNLVCVADDSGIYGMDPETGQLRWRRSIAARGPTEANGRIYLYASGQDLLVLDARTGTTVAHYPIGRPGFFPEPVIVGKRILAVGWGWIYCFADLAD